VPGLGRIPLLGNLFRVRNTQKAKTNLMVFIRPKILRDEEQAAFETNSKYNYMRGLQQERERVNLMPGESPPRLPPVIGPSAPPAAPGPPPPDTATPPGNRGE
jgi:general secretion pathway protein D